jgi:EasF-like predicted methyltransferase
MHHSGAPMYSTGHIIDIRGISTPTSSNTDEDMQNTIASKFMSVSTPFQDQRIVRNGHAAPEVMVRSLPTIILYSDKGLEIFDKITFCPDYYLTNAEIDILKTWADDMVKDIDNEVSLFELGCGSMRKVGFFLEAFVRAGKTVTYYAIDLSESSLNQSITPFLKAFPSIKFIGLWGTYQDSLHWIADNIPQNVKKVYLWFGSSIGNFTRKEATAFVRNVSMNGMNEDDLFICGVDRRNSYEMLSLAYNDSQNITRDFIMSGLDHVNTIMSSPVFDRSKFGYVSIYNEVAGRHEAYYESLCDQNILMADKEIKLRKSELIHVEYSYKYNETEISELVHDSGLINPKKWTDSKQLYDIHLFCKPKKVGFTQV